MLPNGMMLEKVDVQADEREARSRMKAFERTRKRRTSAASQGRALDTEKPSSFAESPLWMTNHRRFSSPMPQIAPGSPASTYQFTQSSIDLRSAKPRSPSPSRVSLSASERPRSLWSRSEFRSASASVISLAPSGSMIDMHLGLAMDKGLPSLPSDYEKYGQPTSNDDEMYRNKKKKRSLSRLLSKMNLANSDPRRETTSHASFATTQTEVFGRAALQLEDSEPLEPPVPSYFAQEPSSRRSSVHSSALSQSRVALMPPSVGSPRGSQTDLSSQRPSWPATPSASSMRSAQLSRAEGWSPAPKDFVSGDGDYNRTDMTESDPWTLSPHLHREKSLPLLPYRTDLASPSIAAYPPSLDLPRSSSPGLDASRSSDSIGGGRKAKAKSNIRGLSLFVNPFKRGMRQDQPVFDYAPHEQTLDLIARDPGFVAYR